MSRAKRQTDPAGVTDAADVVEDFRDASTLRAEPLLAFADLTGPKEPGYFGERLFYRLSHIEVVTLEALAGIAESWFGPGEFSRMQGRLLVAAGTDLLHCLFAVTGGQRVLAYCGGDE